MLRSRRSCDVSVYLRWNACGKLARHEVQGSAFRVYGSDVLEVSTRFNLSVVGAKKRVVEARNDAFLRLLMPTNPHRQHYRNFQGKGTERHAGFSVSTIALRD